MINASTRNFTHDNQFIYFMLRDGVAMIEWSAYNSLEDVSRLQTELFQVYERNSKKIVAEQDDRIVYYIIITSQRTYE